MNITAIDLATGAVHYRDGSQGQLLRDTWDLDPTEHRYTPLEGAVLDEVQRAGSTVVVTALNRIDSDTIDRWRATDTDLGNALNAIHGVNDGQAGQALTGQREGERQERRVQAAALSATTPSTPDRPTSAIAVGDARIQGDTATRPASAPTATSLRANDSRLQGLPAAPSPTVQQELRAVTRGMIQSAQGVFSDSGSLLTAAAVGMGVAHTAYADPVSTTQESTAWADIEHGTPPRGDDAAAPRFVDLGAFTGATPPVEGAQTSGIGLRANLTVSPMGADAVEQGSALTASAVRRRDDDDKERDEDNDNDNDGRPGDDALLVPPTVVGDLIAGTEDIGFVIAPDLLLANDTTGNAGSQLRFAGVGNATHGSVSRNRQGDIVFLPEADYFGPATFDYWVTDDSGLTSRGTVTLDIAPVNDIPIVADEAVEAQEDHILRFEQAALLANDRDVDSATVGDRLRIVAVSDAEHGTVRLATDGQIEFIPDVDYFGPAAFRYTVSDGQGGTAEGVARLTLAPVNDAPAVTGETVSTEEDTTLTIDVAALLANDRDVDNPHGDLRIVRVGEAAHGTVELSPDGRIRFVPEADYFGTAQFSYTVSDGEAETLGLARIDLAPVNDAPIVTAERVTSLEDEALVFAAADLLANDSDVDNAHSSLRIASVGNTQGGAVTRDADGGIRFTPHADYFGAAGFEYTVSDGAGGETVGRVDIDIAPVNDAPRATGERASTLEDTAVTFTAAELLANDNDVDNPHETLRIGAVGDATHGTVVLLSNGAVRFTPEPNYFGAASFAYTVTDGVGGLSSATVTLSVTPDIYNVRITEIVQNVDAVIGAAQLAAESNDARVPLRVVAIANGSHGAVSLDTLGDADWTNDLIRFTPEADYYSRLYNPALGRFQDLWRYADDPYNNRVRSDSLRDLEPATFRFTLEDTFGNQYDRLAVVGINYRDIPAVTTPIVVDYADYRYPVSYDDLGNPVDYFTRTQSSGAHGQLTSDSPYPDDQISYRGVLYAGAGAVAVNTNGAWTYTEQVGPPKDYTWKGTHGQGEFLLWARDPAGNESDRLAVLFGGYGDDGNPYDNSIYDPASLPHGSVAQAAYAQTIVPGTGSLGLASGIVTAGPIVLDLDGNGVSLVDPTISVAYFDMAGDGIPRRTGWIDRGDGLLAFDANQDGRVEGAAEIEFTRYRAEARTDLEGLRAFDANGDGRLDAADSQWPMFGVWADANGNGVSEAGEFRPMAERRVTGLALDADGRAESQGLNQIHGYGEFTRDDGTRGRFADAAFAYEQAPPPETAASASLTISALASDALLLRFLDAVATAPRDAAPVAEYAPEPLPMPLAASVDETAMNAYVG